MITVNCAALPGNLIESELFGREKGAFTGAHAMQVGRFEIADGGTIFLDEIGEMPLELQTKLLRVLEQGEFERLGSPKTIKVDVRVIASTNRDLEAEIKNKRFREDLFYRLNVFPVSIPPLKQRYVLQKSWITTINQGGPMKALWKEENHEKKSRTCNLWPRTGCGVRRDRRGTTGAGPHSASRPGAAIP
jgi:transcriptional regulator with GAF, ATPase, and Fis domain